MTASVPNANVYSLSCSEEAESLVSQAIDEFAQARQQGLTPKSSIFFLGRENFPLKYIENAQYDLKKSLVVADTCGDFTKSVTIATNGPLVVQGLKAVEQLRDQGVGVLLVNVSNVNQLDSETFKSCLQKTAGFLVTVEDHQVVGGMGSLLSHGLAREGIEFKLKSLGVSGGFGQSAYLAEELYQKHGLDAQSISQAVLNLLNN